jgi:hypothetical protein
VAIIKSAQNTNTTRKQYRYTKQTLNKQTKENNVTGKDIKKYWDKTPTM